MYNYKPDIEMTVSGERFNGMGVVNLGPKNIAIVSKAKLDLLMISSCHRNFTIENVDPGWFGGASKQYVYNYTPTPIEREGFCPLYIQAFDRSGVTAWGYMAFRSDEKLLATLECNGKTLSMVGVSVCASKAGFEQGLEFKESVTFAQGPDCDIVKKSETSFRVRSKKGFCLATFSNGTDIHRLVLLGYNQALIRGE